MVDDNNHGDGKSPRRTFLKLSGVAGAAALAGCSSETPSDGDGTTTTSTTSGGDSGGTGDQSLTVPGTYVPTNMQWNSYAPSHYSNPGRAFVFDPFIFYNQKTDTIIPTLFQDWEKDGDTLTVTLREGVTWHDGEPVTAEDFVTKYTIDKGFQYTIANYITDATAVDETTVEYSLAQSYRSDLLVLTFSGSWMNTPTHQKYGEFAQRLRDASSQEETDTVLSDIQDYQPSEPLGCGPFQFESANQQNLNLTRYEDHPEADTIPVPKAQVAYMGSNQQQWAAVKNGRTIDATTTTFFPERIVNSLPDYIRQYQMPAYNGFALAFNHDDEVFGNRNVRRAFAYILDQEKMASLADPTKTAVTAPTGVGSYHTGTWQEKLGGDVSAYQTYMGSDSTSKAEALLRGEGFSKEGGQWYTPSGEQLTLEIPAPAGWSDIVSFVQTTAQMLTNFGIETQNSNVETTTFFGQYWGPSNFRVIPWFWNNSFVRPKPFFSLGWLLTSDTSVNTLNFPEEPVVPPMGEPDGEATATDVRGILRDLGTSSDEARTTELTRELAWVVNQSLPELPLIEKVSQSFWNTNEWNVPEKGVDEQYVRYPYYYWPRTGTISPKTE
ncbi:twin-arginine translocation signal domain-containing protein (plasmid) [Halarchaeum sp. CBA1220]|uniref:ABC transporter substrate-binding protein n=1 Tax=Halarchaeum sp. CBA1220 TaxID=1853682 RepID=UPI000F3A818F|nr:ABC transporter substrate-binding protein [Halarchaeum sp. CBA1220]QLC34775.1 twin-arginine translocation signal domain-containing protein [Halarchaeum sp. CBA1220]